MVLFHRWQPMNSNSAVAKTHTYTNQFPERLSSWKLSLLAVVFAVTGCYNLKCCLKFFNFIGQIFVLFVKTVMLLATKFQFVTTLKITKVGQ